jgi:hypothetical protein
MWTNSRPWTLSKIRAMFAHVVFVLVSTCFISKIAEPISAKFGTGSLQQYKVVVEFKFAPCRSYVVSRNTLVSRVTRCRLTIRVQFPESAVSIPSLDPPCLLSNGHWELFLQGYRGQIKLITQLHLVSRLRIRGAISLPARHMSWMKGYTALLSGPLYTKCRGAMNEYFAPPR